jgi:hypothetical protein
MKLPDKNETVAKIRLMTRGGMDEWSNKAMLRRRLFDISVGTVFVVSYQAFSFRRTLQSLTSL